MKDALITKEELAVFRNVFKRLDFEYLIDFGNTTSEFTLNDFSKFFNQLPQVVKELSKNDCYTPFIESLNDVSSTLYLLAISEDLLRDVGYLFDVIARSAQKEAANKCSQSEPQQQTN